MTQSEKTPFPLIDISGQPCERGRAHGEAGRERVRRSATLYRHRLEKLGIGDAHHLITAMAVQMEGFAADLVEEMRGIAEGAGIDFDDIVLINGRTEIVAMAQRKDTVTDGCTGLVVLPDRSATGGIIHAQNWDWLAECAETAIVLRIRRDDGPDILTFTEAGGLARHGFNAAGIAISANYLESDRDYRQPGVPLPLIRRKALEQAHLADAIRIVATTPKACSNNMMLSHKDGFAIDFECAPDEAFPLYPERDLLVHANHWLSPVALSKLKDTGLADVPDSVYRDWRVKRVLEPKARIGIDDVKSALSDRFGAPFAVCRPAIAELSGNLSATVATIVMQPDAGTMEVAPMPAEGAIFARYNIA